MINHYAEYIFYFILYMLKNLYLRFYTFNINFADLCRNLLYTFFFNKIVVVSTRLFFWIFVQSSQIFCIYFNFKNVLELCYYSVTQTNCDTFSLYFFLKQNIL